MKSTVLVSVAVAFLPSAALAFVAPPPPPPPPSSSFLPTVRPSLPTPPTTPVTARVVGGASSSSSFLTELSGTTKEVSEGAGGGGGGGEWSIGAPSRRMLEAARRKSVARNALGKLLERQQRDMQQTLDLLASLEGVEDDVFEREDRRLRRHREEDIDDASSSSSSSSMIDYDDDYDAIPSSSIMSSIVASVAAGVDYGYTSRSEGCRSESIKSGSYLGGGGGNGDARFEGYGPPGNIFALGSSQFTRNLLAMIGEYNDEESNPTLTDVQRDLQCRLRGLTLNSTAIWERERARGPVVVPYVIKVPYYALCYLLDVVFEGRDAFGRFFLLETVARMPYFSYITMLHLYETLGFWRRSADIKRIHFAEEWNEVSEKERDDRT
jgi:hypothetical protein